jgi:glycosyltransferase involved in cell wall biosynthesis
MQYTRDKKLLLTVYFCFYFAVFLFLGIGHRTLLQVHPVFFHYNRDLAELMLIGSGLPRFMIAHPVCFAFADTLGFMLPIPLLGYAFRKDRFSPLLGWIFCAYVTLYLLLADIFWQIHHGPFILYVLLSFAFLTNREDRFYFILRGCRYYFLYIFVSAAIWKTVRGAAFEGQEMSNILLHQHIDLLSGDCQTGLCRFYAWLIGHPGISQGLYIGAVFMESVFVVGFFTRRFDRLLLGLAILFVAADLLVMRIPYWTLLLGGITLWMDNGRRRRGIVIYETTHHENLPALLDLSEARFSRVVVFLRESSYRNVCGKGEPAERWPATEFIVQPEGCANRVFIRRLFVFLDNHRYTHLHLSTLDNNMLLFAVRLCMAGNVRVSLTLHEVNAWFDYPWRSLRDWTENLAKLILHRRISHYSFFLPAMAEALRQRMPQATAVFIPSRFYSVVATPKASPLRPFTIVIPGSVDDNRRDYAFVARFFRSWLPGKAAANASGDTARGTSGSASGPRAIRLVILGDSDSPYGADIVAQLRALESTRFSVLAFSGGYIPESTYEQELATADLLWSPLKLHKLGSRNNPEVYGRTTASGLTADLLLNNIPALVPEGLLLPDVFRAALLPYRSADEAGRLLDRLLDDHEWLEELRIQIAASFLFFSKEHFYTAFSRLTQGNESPAGENEGLAGGDDKREKG